MWGAGQWQIHRGVGIPKCVGMWGVMGTWSGYGVMGGHMGSWGVRGDIGVTQGHGGAMDMLRCHGVTERPWGHREAMQTWRCPEDMAAPWGHGEAMGGIGRVLRIWRGHGDTGRPWGHRDAMETQRGHGDTERPWDWRRPAMSGCPGGVQPGGAPVERHAAPSLPPTPLTLALVGDHGHGEVDACIAGVGCGADGVIAGLQQRQLGEQQRGGQPHGWELLQHLQQGGAAEPLPVLVQTGVLQHASVARGASCSRAGSPAPTSQHHNIPKARQNPASPQPGLWHSRI